MTTTRPRWPARVAVAGVALALVAVLAVVAAMWAGSEPAHRATAAEPFAPDSPFRTPVPADARVDPASDLVTGHLTGEGRVYAALVEFGIPVYTATAGTPRYRVPCLRTQWGPCPFDGVDTPIPDGARPHTGSDGAMVVVDEDARLSYEFWQAVRTVPGWVTSFGAITPLAGSGWGGAATGAGASRLAGVVRVAEIEHGEIEHALVLQSDNTCARMYRAPAIKKPTAARTARTACRRARGSGWTRPSTWTPSTCPPHTSRWRGRCSGTAGTWWTGAGRR